MSKNRSWTGWSLQLSNQWNDFQRAFKKKSQYSVSIQIFRYFFVVHMFVLCITQLVTFSVSTSEKELVVSVTRFTCTQIFHFYSEYDNIQKLILVMDHIFCLNIQNKAFNVAFSV